MNIFFLHSNPKIAAQMHCDKHLVKMILESCQLLSTAHRILDGVEYQGLTKSGRKIRRWDLRDANLNTFIYTATHINHPSAIWCRSGLKQYEWLASLTKELCIEYTYRYGKTHKCEVIGLVDWFVNNTPKNIKDIPWTDATPAMDTNFIVYENGKINSVLSYRNYYIKAKSHLAIWKGKINSRNVPFWYLV